jgi:hypothetical protein
LLRGLRHAQMLRGFREDFAIKKCENELVWLTTSEPYELAMFLFWITLAGPPPYLDAETPSWEERMARNACGVGQSCTTARNSKRPQQ